MKLQILFVFSVSMRILFLNLDPSLPLAVHIALTFSYNLHSCHSIIKYKPKNLAIQFLVATSRKNILEAYVDCVFTTTRRTSKGRDFTIRYYNLLPFSPLIFANLILSILEFPTHDNLGIITNFK